MGAPSVTYTGAEVAILAGIIAGALPTLGGDDFDVAEHLLDKALAALPRPLPPEIETHVARLRSPPLERFWDRLCKRLVPGVRFDVLDASNAGEVRPSEALAFLDQLHSRKTGLSRVNDHHWIINP